MNVLNKTSKSLNIMRNSMSRFKGQLQMEQELKFDKINEE